MKRIIFIPIEPLEERYSANWLRWFPKEFDRLGINYVMINPRPLSNKIRDGSFLDISGTHYYKAMQLAEISRMIYNYQITDNDVFFIADAWYSGIEALAYMRDGLGIDFKIAGILFAGTYDPNDFLTKKGMEYWGKDLENSWFRILDKFFIASEFHKKLICSKRDVDPKKLVVTGHPSYYEGTHCEKENIIVFPHRLDEEKNPHLFDVLSVMVEESFPDWKCIKTKEVCKTKQEYLDLLERAKISVSFADQETWGFAMIESLFADCIPIVPDRLCYPELYSQTFCYSSFEECLSKVVFAIKNRELLIPLVETNKEYIKVISEGAIERMVREMIRL